MGTNAASSYALTRRSFLTGSATVAALLGAGALSGCGSHRTSSSSGSTASTLTYALNEDPQALDPARVNDFGSLELSANLYEGLFRFKGNTCDPEPCLATSYDVSDDGLTYTFHLRKGVKFHDGTDFDANAVVTNFERQMNGKGAEDMGYAEMVFGTDETGTGVKSVTAKDSHTVVAVLRAACTPFVRNLAMALGTPIVSPTALKKHNGNLSTAPCGTGPYKLSSWEKGSTVILKSFSDYWGTKPKVKRVVFRVMPESAARVTALGNGEVDVITAIEKSAALTVKKAGSTVKAIDGLNTSYMIFNTASEKLKDAKVRKAICQAIDVEEIVSALFGKYATAAHSLMPEFLAPYDKDVSYPDYDPDAAKATLSAAGVTELTCLTYTTAMQYNPAGGKALAESVQGYLDKVGVKLTVNAYDWTTFRSKRTEEYFDLAFAGWAGDNGDPDNFMSLFASGSNATMSVYSDDEYKSLVAKGLATPDGSARDDIYLQLEKKLTQDLPVLPISHAKTVCGYTPKVHNFTMHPTGWSKLVGVSKTA
ncbi:MAG: ABC transporter substrate-binding protein [Olsenella sp.]|jgi:peptide/nickel transport system substrate-binding protein|nr:ABC transporter substrate-binding protein [Olsenella sp.]